MKLDKNTQVVLLLIVATTFEVLGDAVVRKCVYQYTGAYRIVAGVAGAILLFGYGFTLNLAPVEFGKIVGQYIATLFVVWQIISYVTTGVAPSMSVIVGGLMIFAGGLIVTFGKF
jgi:small multidrug resistance family-3 protein